MGQSPKSKYYNIKGIGLPFFQGCTEFGEIYPIIKKYCSKPIKIAQKDDILMSVRAPIGSLNIASQKCCIGRGLCSIRSKNNDRFVFYLLKANLDMIQSYGGGTTFKAINKNEINKLPFTIPPLPIQKKIASFLSNYDDLIENNTKRIKLLENIAQLIYKEWFVKFKFPGYENVKMVYNKELDKEIPEGWEVKGITDVDYFNFISENIKQYEEEKEYFATANIDGINITKKGIMYSYKDKPSRAQKQPTIYSVWFARMKDTYKVLGFTEANKNIANNSILSSGFAGFKSDKYIFPFLYYTINSEYFHKEKDRFATGSTQVSLNNEGLSKIKVILPTTEIIIIFGKKVLPIIDQIFLLQQKNDSLRQARDLLLPKLISGEIDVSDLDIKGGE